MNQLLDSNPRHHFSIYLRAWCHTVSHMPLAYCNKPHCPLSLRCRVSAPCLLLFPASGILGGRLFLAQECACSFPYTPTHPSDKTPGCQVDPLPRRTQSLRASRMHKHLSDHLGSTEAPQECKQILPPPLNCFWPLFMFRKGATVRMMGGCCTCHPPSGAFSVGATGVWNVLHVARCRMK